MARRDIPMVELNEIIFRWHRGDTNSAIQRSLGTDRKTVRKYVRLALRVGLRRELPLPADPELAALLAPARQALAVPLPAPGKARLAAHHHALLERWSADPAVSLKQMWRLLLEQHPDTAAGYTTVREYVQEHFRPVTPAVTVRLSTPPGLQAQVDFGYAGFMTDLKTGKRRKAWAFVMTLSYSRYRFVRLVFNQDAKTWVDCHVRAFDFFGGVPRTILLDNLKAGVVKPDAYDPTLNPLYQALERHYGFAADPAKVRTPQHKGKVERAVAIVRGQLLAGRGFANLDEANAAALRWCRDEAGRTVHATTKRLPAEAFEQDERTALLPLPLARFELATWQETTVPRDHHVVFEGAYYSVPTRYIGHTVSVRGTDRLVQIFHDGQLVKTHLPAERGTQRTDPQDYPAAQRAYLLATADVCRAKAREVGPSVAELVELAVAPQTQQGLRRAQAILRLADAHGAAALEAACRRGLHFGATRVTALRAVLEKGLAFAPLETEEPPVRPSAPPGFMRPAGYFSHVGGAR